MASPFNVFRKHQRAMLVVVGILCMIGFSIAGVIDYSSSTAMRSAEDPVVATAYGKNIRASEVRQLLQRRVLAINFLAECKAAEFNFPGFAQVFAQQFEMQYFGPATEESVVQTWVLDERARRMGMVVSDSAVNKFLRDLTNDKVKTEVFNDIVKRLGTGQPQVFDALRGELLAFRLREMGLGRMQTTPAQRWDYYRRQKQRATVELAAVPVEDFIGELPDATTEELQAFFDAHKEQEPDPKSPTPGFKVPKKAAFQVVIAKFSDFVDEDAVTEEEIKEHYEKFKDTRYLWDQYALEGEDDETEESANEADKPADSTDEKATEEKKTSSFWRTTDLLVSLIARPASALAGLLAADDDAPAEKDDATSDAANPADTSAQSPDTSEKAIGAKTAGKKAKAKLPAVAPPITDEYLLPRDIRQGPHPKHAPLWKVEKAIRTELAREKANKKIDEALQVVREKMRKHSRRLGPEDTESKLPGFDKLAESQGLTALETGLLTRLELQEKYPDLTEARGEGVTFQSIAYSGMPKFQSTTVQDVEANRYLVWKIEEEDAYVPEFADVRSKVLRAWKMTKARDLAAKKAKELAAEANKAAKPLKDLFADREGLTVTQTPPFSWLTRGTANVDNRSPLRISEVEGVASPGPDFMREVFSLGVGSTGEAMNEPQTTAYVVRLISLDPPGERLRTAFLADPFGLYNEVAQEDMSEVQRAWIKGIEAEARLTWKETEAERRRR